MKRVFTILYLAFAITAYSQPTEPLLRIEKGMHSGLPTQISVDAYSKLLLSAGYDNTARLWDANNGALLNTFRVPIYKGQAPYINSCALSPDGKLIALGVSNDFENSNATIRIYSSQTSETIFQIDMTNGVSKIIFSPNGESMAVLGVGISIFSTKNWKLITHLNDFIYPVMEISFSNQNKLAVAGGTTISLYDREYKLIAEQETSPSSPTNLTFNNKGDLLAVVYGLGDATVEFRNANDLSLIKKTPYYSSKNVSFSRDDQNLYVQRVDNKVPVYGYLSIMNIKDYSIENVALSNFDYNDLKVLSNGNITIQSGTELDLRKASGEVIWRNTIKKMDFMYDDLTHLRVNATGNIIGFTTRDSVPLTFDVTSRKLEVNQSEFPSYTDKNYTEVTCWNRNKCEGEPAINNIKVDLGDNSTTSVDISNNGDEVVLGTVLYLYKFDSKANLKWKTAMLAPLYCGINICGSNKTVITATEDETIR